MAITPRIKDEISAPLEHGYSFPLAQLAAFSQKNLLFSGIPEV